MLILNHTMPYHHEADAKRPRTVSRRANGRAPRECSRALQTDGNARQLDLLPVRSRRAPAPQGRQVFAIHPERSQRLVPGEASRAAPSRIAADPMSQTRRLQAKKKPVKKQRRGAWASKKRRLACYVADPALTAWASRVEENKPDLLNHTEAAQRNEKEPAQANLFRCASDEGSRKETQRKLLFEEERRRSHCPSSPTAAASLGLDP